LLVLENTGLEGWIQQGFSYAFWVAGAPDSMGFGAGNGLLNGKRLSLRRVPSHLSEESFLFQWEPLHIFPTNMSFLTCSQLRFCICFWLEIRATPYPAFQPVCAISLTKQENKDKNIYTYVHT